MGRFNLTLLILLMSFSAIAQKFEITPDGFVTKEDKKSYYVMDSIKADQAYLYKQSLIYFNSLFKSPKNVISTVENESITLNFTEKQNIIFGLPWTVDMTYNFRFKDGKIRIDAPVFNKAYQSDMSTITINSSGELKNYPIYKRNGNGEIRGKDGERTKSLIEAHTNLFITVYLASVLIKKNDN